MSLTYRETRLSNGLRIAAEVDPHAHSAACGFFVKTGARDEDRAVMGVSHFLEHMMFKGTDRRTAEQINRGFDRIGAKSNAYTSSEITCFHATVLPEHLLGAGHAVDILADMMRPALRQEDFDTEKKVILEEIAMYMDNPFWVLYEKALEVHCGAPAPFPDAVPDHQADLGAMHPLGHRVLGTTGSVSALTSEQMRSYFDSRYSADNTVVALAGRLDFDAAVAEIEQRCGAWPRTGATRVPTHPPTAECSFTLRDPKLSRGYALMLSPGPGAADPRRYAASLLAHILGGPDNSRLHWALIETGMAEDADAGFEPRDGCGDFLVYVSCDPERLEEVWAVVEGQVEGLARTLTDEDLEKIRAKSATAVTLAGERAGGRMQRLGRQLTYLDVYTTLEEELERINSVTLDDVRGVLREFPMRPRTVGRLLPGVPAGQAAAAGV